MQQNAKMHGNHTVWDYQITLQKMYSLSAFIFLRTKKLKHMQNKLYGERKAVPKTSILSIF